MCFNIVSTDTSPQGSSLSYFVAFFMRTLCTCQVRLDTILVMEVICMQNDAQRFQEYLLNLQTAIDSLQRNATVLESITNANDRIERSTSIKRECVAILQESEKLEATAKLISLRGE